MQVFGILIASVKAEPELLRLATAGTDPGKTQGCVLHLKSSDHDWHQRRWNSARFYTGHGPATPTLEVGMVDRTVLTRVGLEPSSTLDGSDCACDVGVKQRLKDSIHGDDIDLLMGNRGDQLRCGQRTPSAKQCT